MPRLDPESLDLLLSTVRDYAERELPPAFLLKLDHEDVFPAKVLRDLYDPQQIGLHLVFVPEEAGGLGGSAYDIYRVCVGMAEIDLGIATGVLATCLGADPIMVGATPGAEDRLDETHRRRGASDGVRRDRAAGGERPRRPADDGDARSSRTGRRSPTG